MFQIQHALMRQINSSATGVITITSCTPTIDPEIGQDNEFILAHCDGFPIRLLVSMLPAPLQRAFHAGQDITQAMLRALIGRHQNHKYGYMMIPDEVMAGTVTINLKSEKRGAPHVRVVMKCGPVETMLIEDVIITKHLHLDKKERRRWPQATRDEVLELLLLWERSKRLGLVQTATILEQFRTNASGLDVTVKKPGLAVVTADGTPLEVCYLSQLQDSDFVAALKTRHMREV